MYITHYLKITYAGHKIILQYTIRKVLYNIYIYNVIPYRWNLKSVPTGLQTTFSSV